MPNYSSLKIILTSFLRHIFFVIKPHQIKNKYLTTLTTFFKTTDLYDKPMTLAFLIIWQTLFPKKPTNFISVATSKSTEAVHGFLHGALPGDVQIEAGHLTGVETHHVVSVSYTTAGGEPTHGALNVFPGKLTHCNVYMKIEINYLNLCGVKSLNYLVISHMFTISDTLVLFTFKEIIKFHSFQKFWI